MIVLHIHRQRCACGATETFSRLYSAKSVPDFAAHRLTPINALSPLDAVHIERLPVQSIPVCAACVNARPAVSAEQLASWQDTLKRKYASPAPQARAQGTPTKPSTRKPPATAEELA